MQCKDDSLVLLTLTLYSALFHNRSVSTSILDFCRLALKPQSRNFESIIKVEKIIINCLKIFTVDPPCFRICTYIEASSLAGILSTFYSLNELPFSVDVLAVLRQGLKTAIDRVNPYLFGGQEW